MVNNPKVEKVVQPNESGTRAAKGKLQKTQGMHGPPKSQGGQSTKSDADK
jgi:hypothetical protein